MVDKLSADLSDVFQALADPTRRHIVHLLSTKPHTVGELVPPFNMTKAAISKHIKVLEAAGLVDREVRGRLHICSLNALALADAYRWLGGYERFWEERLDALEALIAARRTSKKS